MTCRECKGSGYLICPVCKGSKKDPRYEDKTCGYCNGDGRKECGECYGKGETPYSHANL
ncbi:MAG: hypothetical protein IJA60_01780 [Clostridia bacterium]|nr:hypothetical protein [Clostridia bacterium]